MVTRRQDSGFTLIELMVALALVGLFLALALPNFPVLTNGAQLGASSRELTAALREARSQAIRENREIRIAIAADGASYAVDGVARPFRAAAIDRLAFDAAKRGSAALSFFADGASSGGRFALARGGLSREVVVDPVTGRVTASE